MTSNQNIDILEFEKEYGMPVYESVYAKPGWRIRVAECDSKYTNLYKSLDNISLVWFGLCLKVNFQSVGSIRANDTLMERRGPCGSL